MEKDRDIQRKELKLAAYGITLAFLLIGAGLFANCGTERRMCLFQAVSGEDAIACLEVTASIPLATAELPPMLVDQLDAHRQKLGIAEPSWGAYLDCIQAFTIGELARQPNLCPMPEPQETPAEPSGSAEELGKDMLGSWNHLGTLRGKEWTPASPHNGIAWEEWKEYVECLTEASDEEDCVTPDSLTPEFKPACQYIDPLTGGCSDEDSYPVNTPAPIFAEPCMRAAFDPLYRMPGARRKLGSRGLLWEGDGYAGEALRSNACDYL